MYRKILIICSFAAVSLMSSACGRCDGNSSKENTIETGETTDIGQVVGNQSQVSIVETTHQKYSYKEMMSELELLASTYPNLISVEKLSKTNQGRSIPLVYLGNKQAPQKILVTAAIHAREYMTAQLTMAMIEYYAQSYKTGSVNGESFQSLFNSVCLVILPMLNPDGVEIAQQGVNGAITNDAKQWVNAQLKKGNRADQIKSNANGVDLNRNFSFGFGKDPHRVGSKGFDHYNGVSPYSEVETKMLKSIADKYTYSLFLNYHTHGNLLYYGCKNSSLNDVNAKALQVARVIQKTTGYAPKAEVDAAYGSWADEAEHVYRKPSVTIEIGSRNPVPISEFNSIFKKNKMVWAYLMCALKNGEL